VTGKPLPYPVALAQFVGVPTRMAAENGGVMAVADTDAVAVPGNMSGAQAVVDAYRAADSDLG